MIKNKIKIIWFVFCLFFSINNFCMDIQTIGDGITKPIHIAKEEDYLKILQRDRRKILRLTKLKSPLSDIPTEDLPQLEELFIEEIPKKIKKIIGKAKNNHFRSNCLILSGLQGSKKNIIAEHIARSAMREIRYINAELFGSKFCNSIKNDLFMYFGLLRQEVEETGISIIVIIDKIDILISETTHKLIINNFKSFLESQIDDPKILIIGITDTDINISFKLRRLYTSISIK